MLHHRVRVAVVVAVHQVYDERPLRIAGHLPGNGGDALRACDSHLAWHQLLQALHVAPGHQSVFGPVKHRLLLFVEVQRLRDHDGLQARQRFFDQPVRQPIVAREEQPEGYVRPGQRDRRFLRLLLVLPERGVAVDHADIGHSLVVIQQGRVLPHKPVEVGEVVRVGLPPVGALVLGVRPLPDGAHELMAVGIGLRHPGPHQPRQVVLHAVGPVLSAGRRDLRPAQGVAELEDENRVGRDLPVLRIPRDLATEVRELVRDDQ